MTDPTKEEPVPGEDTASEVPAGGGKGDVETPDEPMGPDILRSSSDGEEGTLSAQLDAAAFEGDITRKIIKGPAEMIGEFDDAGNAAAAKANLDIFLRWIATGVTDKAPPAVALIVNQSKLDPVEDRPRKVDFAQFPPLIWIEGACVVLDAPKSKQARDVVRKVFNNSKPKRIYDRPSQGGGVAAAAKLAKQSSARSSPRTAPAVAAPGGGGAPVSTSKKLAVIGAMVLLIALALVAAKYGGMFAEQLKH